MNVQTSSTNNGSVIKSNHESNIPNESKSSNSNSSQSAQHPQSQLEITGVSRSSHPVPSQKESNRFRIVKTDADKKNEPVDESGQAIIQPNEQGIVQNSLNKNFTDANSIQAKNVLNNYQRGRWHVAEFSTENFVPSKSLNQIGHVSTQNQTKNEESTNLIPNQSNQINEQNKVLSNTQSNAVTTNQSQSNNNPGTNINFYLANQQIYHQQTQTPAQPYQISSSNITQSSHQTNSPVNNNLVGNSSQITNNQNLTQNNQSNININNTKQIDNSKTNTQPHNQQNFPSQAQSQVVNVTSMNIKENISVGSQENSLINSQIPPQQASPKDQNLVKLPNGVNSSENLQYSSNDPDAVSNDQTQETKKTDHGIHDKIAEAMDMVKSHLTQAVRDEIVTLKNQIKNLREHCSRLEQENRMLKTNMPSEILRHLENMGIFSHNGTSNHINESDNRSQDNMLSSFTEKVINKNDFLSNLPTSSK